MNSIRWLSGSVSKTWNSINPATLSGAIDVIVVEHEDGSLACSPFHVRFGKFSLLRPYEKKVEFKVHGEKQDYAMKLGEGGEAFFVFETSARVPEAMMTSPLVSPASSPSARPLTPTSDSSVNDVEPLDLDGSTRRPPPTLSKAATSLTDPLHVPGRARAETASSFLSSSLPGASTSDPELILHAESQQSYSRDKDFSKDVDRRPPGPAPTTTRMHSTPDDIAKRLSRPNTSAGDTQPIASSPPLLPKEEAVSRALNLSKKLLKSNIPTQVNEEGDLMLDMTGYKSSEEEALRAEVVARGILSEELEGNYDIGSLIGADEKGNLWIYSSEEAKEAAARKAAFPIMQPAGFVSTDALSDPGYHSDDARSVQSVDLQSHKHRTRRESEPDSGIGLATPPDSPTSPAQEESRHYAKTLRLSSDQLRALNLKYGPNAMSFTAGRATCTAYMYLWKSNAPIVISDIDGTITKSDALGHVLNMLGRDWTHTGVAKLYTDISANGYNILYLTSRSVGQADTTRTYINGIVQDGGYRLPKGPVIMSPDRTMAALRREIYLRKPEVFKMACLRDIMSLFHSRSSPFYAGFGNRLTDALSYRSVNIPSIRIFTINSNAEVSLDLLSLNRYKTAYTSMRETVDHSFPPVGMLVQEGGEMYTDFNYWRESPDEFEMSDSEDGDTGWDSRIRGGYSEERSSYEEGRGSFEEGRGSYEGGRTSYETFDNDREGEDADEEDEGEEDEQMTESEILSEGLADSYLSTGRGSLEESLSNLVRQGMELEGREFSTTELTTTELANMELEGRELEGRELAGASLHRRVYGDEDGGEERNELEILVPVRDQDAEALDTDETLDDLGDDSDDRLG